MALQQTSLGQAVEAFRGFLSAELQNRNQPSRVEVGNLAQNAPANTTDPSRVNLLVTRIESDGSFQGINYPWEPWLVRLHVLLTPFSTDTTPSVGQNDLRLLGEVAAILHENPILGMTFVEGIPVRLNIIPENISMEALNQLWAIQGEVGFRTSLAYEVSLVPIKTDMVYPEGPLVGELQLFVNDDQRLIRADDGVEQAPSNRDAADLSLTDGADRWFRRLTRAQVAGFTEHVWVASALGAVRLAWELLEPNARWQRLAPANGLATVAPHAQDVTPSAAAAVPLVLPAAGDLPAAGAYQLVLRALPDGATLSTRALAGSPVVLSVYQP